MEETITFALHQDKPIPAAAVRHLYEGATWGHDRSDGGIAAAMERTVALGAWEGDRLVGLARALTDGVYRAYVEDVIVDPEYRGRQVGERMVAALLRALGDIETVSLFCAPERVAFYERNGFRPHATQVMMHRRAGDVP